MARFSSVQIVSDNHSGNRKITYDQAKGTSNSDNPSDNKVVTEKVVNPYSSTAGAGSGEFHVYRHARAREKARWNALDEEEQILKQEADFRKTLEENQAAVESKASKNRKKRQREKEAKRRKKHMKAAGIKFDDAGDSRSNENEEEEFTYVPLAQQEKAPAQDEISATVDSNRISASLPSLEIPNDGSFLEMMKRKLQDEEKQRTKSESGETNQDDVKKASAETATKKRYVLSGDESDEEGPSLPPGK